MYYYYPRLLIFPLIQSIITIISLVFVVGVFDHHMKASVWSYLEYPDVQSLWQYVIAAHNIDYIVQTILLFCSQLFMVLFAVAISLIAASYFKGHPVGVLTSFREACTRWKLVLVYALIESLVALALYFAIDNSGYNLLSLFSLVLTLGVRSFLFFVIPLIAFERLSIWKTLVKSIHMIMHHFGVFFGIVIGVGILGVALGYLPIIVLFLFFRKRAFYPLWAIFVTLLLLFIVVAGMFAGEAFFAAFSAMPADVRDALYIVRGVYSLLVSAFLVVLVEINKTAVYLQLHGQSTGVVDHEQLAKMLRIKSST